MLRLQEGGEADGRRGVQHGLDHGSREVEAGKLNISIAAADLRVRAAQDDPLQDGDDGACDCIQASVIRLPGCSSGPVERVEEFQQIVAGP
eukprot:766082-Hanusia_phi.AAC.3